MQYYMSNFNDADCQSICFGSAPQYDLIHLAGRLLRHGDAPTALTDQQKFEVNQDPKLVKYRKKRTITLERMKSRGYSTRAAAEGTKLAEQYDYYNKKADSLCKSLKSKRLQQAIQDFHHSVHIEEVDRQLNGIKPSSIIAPPKLQYDLPERAQVAQLFSQTADVTSREELYLLRVNLIKTLAQLCKRRESPCRRQQKREHVTSPSNLSTKIDPYLWDEKVTKISGALAVPERSGTSWLFCAFCRWADGEVGEEQRIKLWRVDSLARHLRTQHLTRRRTPFNCPYDGCSIVLRSTEHFANHAERQHGDRLPPSIIQHKS